MSTPSLEVKKLAKEYSKYRAVDGISFQVQPGEVLGLLGPNGAGKSTTIQMLLGITTPTSGVISYFGYDMRTNRQACLQRINYVSAYNTLQYRITVWENLSVFAGLYSVIKPKDKINDLLKTFNIEHLRDQKYINLSSGERTRVNLAKALINDPEIILMDEPTASLDPDIADKTLSIIEDLRTNRNTSILFTSHNMDEVTRICDKVIILDHGKIVKQDDPLTLTKELGTANLHLVFEGDKDKLIGFLKSKSKKPTFTHDYSVTFPVREREAAVYIQAISSLGIKILDLDLKKPDLEDVFLNIARRQK